MVQLHNNLMDSGLRGLADMEIRCYAEAEVRLLEDGTGTALVRVGGYGAVFNSFSEVMTLPGGRGQYREIIRPGAFKRCLENGPDIRLRLDHVGMPLARTTSGTLRCSEDTRGLKWEADLDPTDPDVQRVLPKLRRKDLSNCSFGFNKNPGGDAWRNENGMEIRELHDVDCFDVSLVTIPAYRAATAALRSLEEWEQAQQAQEAEISRTMAAHRSYFDFIELDQS